MKIRTSVQVALIVGACTVLAPLYGPSIRARAATPQDDLDKSFKAITSVYSLLEQNYADPISSEKAYYQGAIPGMLHTLDPHSNFLDPTEYQDMQRKQRAQYFGIGMLIGMDGPKVIAMEPFPGSPAWRADLRRGDVIVAVDGKDVTKQDSAGVALVLRGPRGSPVRVTVAREGAAEPITVTVIRGEIETSLVDAFWYKPGIAYLEVTSFEAQNVSRDVEAALQKLDESKIKGLILDLRENRGGLVTEAVSLSGRFLRDTTTWPSCRKRPANETASVTRPPRFSRRSRIRPWIFDSSSLSKAASTSRATFCASKLVTLRKAMPGLYQKASTRLVSISPRITVTVTGSVAPSRITVTRTGVPRLPRSRSATPAESFLVTSLPSTAIITSPRRRSARHAGEPGNGSMAITLVPSMEISMPMPKYCARCLRCMSEYSVGSRKLECGSSVCSMPGIAPW